MNKITLKGIKEKYNLIEGKYGSSITWRALSRLPLPEGLIREAVDKVDWVLVSVFSKLSEEFIREFKHYVNWYWISEYQKLSESFIREFKDEVDWYYISISQKLSEQFIREMQDYVDWNRISIYQPLSEDFIREFADKVDWGSISRYQPVSKEFLAEFGYEPENNSDKPELYWKERVQKTGLYECHDDFFYAYKGIRSDRYSAYNFQYQYIPGETCECFSDYSDDENSFGLSVWTKEEAKDYCNELVVKVKVYYRDVTAVAHRGGKIRCKRLTVLD